MTKSDALAYAAARLKGEKDKHDQHVVRLLHRVVEVKNLTDEEVATYLTMMIENGRGFSPRYRKALLAEAATRVLFLRGEVDYLRGLED